MATGNDGSGRAPVAIVRPTTSVTSGVGVTQKLVTAAVAFGDLMPSSNWLTPRNKPVEME